MSDDYINILFAEDRADDELSVYNNVTDYYNNTVKSKLPPAVAQKSNSTYTSLRNLMRSRANSASSYVKTLMGGDTASYENIDSLTFVEDGGYQPTPYTKKSGDGYQVTPYTKPSRKGPYGQDIPLQTSKPSPFKPLKRPMAPGGTRTPTTQTSTSHGQTRDVLRMHDSGYNHDRNHTTVEYMDEARRSTFEVEMGARLKRRGKLFDTAQVKRKYIDGSRDSNLGSALSPPGTSDKSHRLVSKWSMMGMIWVCASPGPGQRPTFYSGVGKMNKLHHSSFTAGSEVVGAGEWIVENGKLMSVSAVSGHYMPTWQALFAAVLHMNQAMHDKMTVMMWNTATKDWEERLVKEFIEAPTAGGRFKVHPKA